jgi:probable rRNA maturation factor
LDIENVSHESSLSVVIGDDKLLKKLNSQYRQIDSATDVLSFTSGELDPDTNLRYLGDVVISLARAEYQASFGGHRLEDELQLLVVHGVLHLLGYDHEEAADKIKMQAAQDKILAQLAIKLSITL